MANNFLGKDFGDDIPDELQGPMMTAEGGITIDDGQGLSYEHGETEECGPPAAE